MPPNTDRSCEATVSLVMTRAPAKEDGTAASARATASARRRRDVVALQRGVNGPSGFTDELVVYDTTSPTGAPFVKF